MIEANRRKLAKRLLVEITHLYEEVKEKGDRYLEIFAKQIKRRSFISSAENLAYYLAIRNHDLRELQAELVPLGISSLGRLENKTLVTLQSVIHSLASIAQVETTVPKPDMNGFTRGDEQLARNIFNVLGEQEIERKTLIMVTMPSEAAEDKKLIRDLIESGMNVARINCAHDNASIWIKMIRNIQKEASCLEKDIRIMMDIAGPKIRTEWVFTKLKNPKLVVDDQILLTSNFDDLPIHFEGKLVAGSQIPSIYSALKIGDPVLIDDGSIVTEVIETAGTYAVLKVTRVKGNAKRLKAEKGLNFPETDFSIEIMSEKDKKDIAFACQYADVIGCSFIRTAQDIKEIQKQLQIELGEDATYMPIMAKIETVQAITNLAEIIFTAASYQPFALMIARGDLAVETGYIRLAEIQQQIMWIAEAADVPVVWGTEVFDKLIKTGVPSRAEVTDAAEGARSDCVMINKGDYAVEAVKMLDHIFRRMQGHLHKKTPQLRALSIANLRSTPPLDK
ncbi:pyruvate kinase [Facklamia miroungae]|uniref:Pyruvate kinase n=1 Tax=Facklamia miroungae TaxID=120956 RepID=A0A1G7P9Z3_9LACT|nr:pyruvate kinase [Facklamia miroungae]NKZ28636.1 hypothetical protein [Facklamia miroungae]SDF83126.1 pyruvate kinase [Facklamia miroungae]